MVVYLLISNDFNNKSKRDGDLDKAVRHDSCACVGAGAIFRAMRASATLPGVFGVGGPWRGAAVMIMMDLFFTL